ncbi:MAG: putative transcriptional regulator [Acidobacteriota bacterium]|nr:putative transcriptional regulator [Acidobacteriota bacterium]
MKKAYKDMSVGEGLINALEQAVDFEKGKKVKGVTTRKMSIAPLPEYKAPKIKEIRNRLGISQLTFAYVIGVSKKTIEAWECGRNKPQGPAQRILMLLEEDNKFIEKYKLIQSV